MDIATLALTFSALICTIWVFGRVILQLHANSLDFLRENAQVGGQPLAIVKAQQEMQHKMQDVQIERLKELRADRINSLGD